MPNVRTILYLLLLVALAAMTAPASAGTISMAWDPVQHPTLEGYRVYQSTVPEEYVETVEVGLEASVTLTGLADCTTHYLAVKAFDTQDRESPEFSNVVQGWPRPELAAVTPSVIEPDSQTQLTIQGVNFQAGASVQLGGTGLALSNVVVQDCFTVTLTVTTSGAVGGDVSVTVVNPDQVFGAATGLLAVGDDTTPPSISAVQAGSVGATNATVTWSTDEPADSQVLFRASGATGYQETAVSSTLTTSHAVTLNGLSPETQYEFHVRSVDASGNAATSSDDTFTTTASSFTYLRIEAEAAIIGGPIARETGPGAFRGEWLEVPAGTPGGSAGDPAGVADIGFHVPHAADWSVWVRLYGPDLDSDSWFEGVDGATLEPIFTSEAGAWLWVEGRTYDLGEGLHTLTLGGREDLARADRVIVTDDPDFTPTELPGADVTPPVPVNASGQSQDGAAVVSWTAPSSSDAATVVVRYRVDGAYPTHPADGWPLVEVAAGPGSHEHGGLVNGSAYNYSVFVVDESGNASDPATVEVLPEDDPPGPVTNVARTDTM